MASTWSPEQFKSFWQGRKTYLVFDYPNINDKVADYTTSVQNRMEREEQEENIYLSERRFLPVPQSASGVNQICQTSSDIRFWANYGSWTFCSQCSSVSVKVLPHNFSNRPKNDKSTKCICSQLRYIVPLYKNIPTSLLSLTVDDITILRPFHLFLEKYERVTHGY